MSKIMELADSYAEEVDYYAKNCFQANAKYEKVSAARAAVATAVEALAAENKALREDAERYRWLRHGDNDEVILVPCTWTTTGYLPRNEELDAAIDAALTKEATNG